MTPRDEEKLEQLIHRTLRALPERPAPRSLEQRVWAAVAARDTLPWWRKSYADWPAAMRVLFVVTSMLAAVVVIGAVLIGRGETARVVAEVAQQAPWLGVLRGSVVALGEAMRTAFNAIPATWLYGALAIVATAYIGVAGMSAAAYRVLSARR